MWLKCRELSGTSYEVLEQHTTLVLRDNIDVGFNCDDDEDVVDTPACSTKRYM